MADLHSEAIADSSIKLRWREPYVTEGVDTAMLAHPPGVYRGFWLDQDAPAASQAFRLMTASPSYMGSDQGHVAGVDVDQFAMYADPTAGFELAVRESATITVDLSGVAGLWPIAVDTDLYVWIKVTYAPNVPTTAEYMVSDADPRTAPGGDPNAVIIGVIRLGAGSVAIDPAAATAFLYGYQGVGFGDRTVPRPTAREEAPDFVAGDRTLGLLTGEDRWLLPTNAEKKALDAAHTPSAANHFVTENDTTRKVFAEPTVVTVNVVAGNDYVDLDFATYGGVYVGTGAVDTGHRYLDVRRAAGYEAWQLDAETKDSRRIYIAHVCRFGGAVLINPAVDADAQGFYNSGVRVYFSETYSATVATTCDVWYGKRALYSALNQAPALAFPNATVRREGHSDVIGARREWAPTGGELAPQCTVEQQLDNLRARARGPHGINMSEWELAARIFDKDTAEGQLYADQCENTLGVAQFPRAMCYGYNDVGAADAGALVGGERFLLYTESNGALRERIVRRVIGPGGILGSPAYIDPVPTVHATNFEFPGPPVWTPSESDWKIVSLASDGRYVYIRFFENTSGAADRHVVGCWDILERTQRWAAPLLVEESVTGPFEALPSYLYSQNSMHIAVVSSTRIAVNRSWEDLMAAGLGAGIEIRDSATGALISTGYGNAKDAPWGTAGPPITDSYAAGPMVSDGTKVYFVVRVYNGGLVGTNYYEVAQLTITAPTVPPVGAVNSVINMGAWNPDTGSMLSFPRSLVFDGSLVWLNTKFGVVAVNPVATASELPDLRFDQTQKYIFGPAVFDGKHLYFGITDVDIGGTGNLHSHLCYHLVRLTPGTIQSGSATGVLGDILLHVGAAHRWALEAPWDWGVGLGYIDWSTVKPFGAMVYDGEAVWFTKAWCGAAPPLASRELILQHLPNAHEA